jgi:hypothetical protein
VTDSLGELRAVLAGVGERLGEAQGYAATARDRLSDALGLLTALDGQHSEPLVPPELRRAGDELDRGLRLISSGAAVVADIGTRL